MLLHELAHTIVAQWSGMKVPSITLFVFGGVSAIAGEMSSARTEFRVAEVSGLTTATLALLLAALWLITRDEGVSSGFGYLATSNGALAAFNLLREQNVHQLPIVELGHLAGMLTSDDVLRQIEVRLQFRSDET